MTKRRIDLDEALKNPDLDLITDFLADELDAGQVVEVRRRLEEDPAFRDFAAPIVAAWNVQPRWRREPLAHAEVQTAWAKFTRKAGFRHQRRKRLTRWLLTVAFVVLSPILAIAAYSTYLAISMFVAELRGDARASRMMVDFPDSLAFETLPNGTKYRLDSGAVLRPVPGDQSDPLYKVQLRGTAVFLLPDTAYGPLVPQGLSVETQNGRVMLGARVVEVAAGEDTTHVRVLGLARDPSPLGRRGFAGLLPTAGGNVLMLTQGERGRLVKGRAEKIPPGSQP